MTAAALLDYVMIMAVIAACWKLYDSIIPPGGADAMSAEPLVQGGLLPGGLALPITDVPATPLGRVLTRICAAGGTGSITDILAGAKLAYEAIVGAFAAGDLDPVRTLLADDVAKAFDAAISERKARGEILEQLFIGIGAADVVDAWLDGTLAHLDIRFVGQLVSTTRDTAGRVVRGDPRLVVEIPEIWSFERSTTATDPAWLLVATDADE